MYGKQLDAPLEEVTEMIAILKAIQKGQRELHLLTQRAHTMCPNLMDATYHNDLSHFLYYAVDSRTYEIEQSVKTQLEHLATRKQELLNAEKE